MVIKKTARLVWAETMVSRQNDTNLSVCDYPFIEKFGAHQDGCYIDRAVIPSKLTKQQRVSLWCNIKAV